MSKVSSKVAYNVPQLDWSYRQCCQKGYRSRLEMHALLCFTYSGDQEAGQNFKEFQKITSDMEKFNEDLKKNFDTVEFFNLHLRRLMLNKEEYVKDSERIAHLEESMKSMHELISQEVGNLKDSVKSIANLMIADHNSSVEARAMSDISEITSAIDRVSFSSNTSLENFGNSIKEDIAELRNTINRDLQVKVEPETEESTNGSFQNLNEVIMSIEEQLRNINQHVCPAMTAPIALHLEEEETSEQPEQHPSSALAMTPNTVSPHFNAPPQVDVPISEPYNRYVDEAVPTETRTKVMEFLEENSDEFKSLGNRDVLYFGEYDYHYTGSKHERKRTPLPIQELLDGIRPRTWKTKTCGLTRVL